ncbi:MAG: hypothetical protein HQ510_04290 [Candidatus Marinimicrobia bacterium]|nr:hypothetical protein [Candidatus Neomarinimicrobiota bacterium]
MNIKLIILCVVMFLVWSCDSDCDENPQITLQTDLENYSIGENVQLTLSNGLANTLKLDICCFIPDYQLQTLVNEGWTPANDCSIFCFFPYIPMSSGETRLDTMIMNEPGYQRFLLRYQIPGVAQLDSIISNPFWVD